MFSSYAPLFIYTRSNNHHRCQCLHVILFLDIKSPVVYTSRIFSYILTDVSSQWVKLLNSFCLDCQRINIPALCKAFCVEQLTGSPERVLKGFWLFSFLSFFYGACCRILAFVKKKLHIILHFILLRHVPFLRIIMK